MPRPTTQELINIVAQGNGSVRSWNQNDFLGGQEFGKEGVCHPLSVKWIRDRKQGFDFMVDMQSPGSREEVMTLKIRQHANSSRAGADARFFGGEVARPYVGGGYPDDYLASYGLRRAEGFQFERAPHCGLNQGFRRSLLGSFKSVILPRGYYLISFRSIHEAKRSVSGHALAIDAYTNTFFDPNFGEASFGDLDSLKKAFSVYMKRQYPEYIAKNTYLRWLTLDKFV